MTDKEVIELAQRALLRCQLRLTDADLLDEDKLKEYSESVEALTRAIEVVELKEEK